VTLDNEQKIALFRNLIRADEFNRMMYRRMMQGKLIGFYHPAEGAIAPGVAASTFLNQDDNLSPHHRGHGITHMLSKGIDVKYYLAEHTGKDTGCCKGRSAFHFSFPEHKVYMMSGFIGYNFAPVVGWGFAAKRRGKGQVVMNCSGDGSYGQGRAHEALLMAQNWKLPIIFFCENNGMSIFSTAMEMHPKEHISSLADGFGMPSAIVDGQDVFEIAEVVLDAIDRARAGDGPTFIEAKTCALTSTTSAHRTWRAGKSAVRRSTPPCVSGNRCASQRNVCSPRAYSRKPRLMTCGKRRWRKSPPLKPSPTKALSPGHPSRNSSTVCSRPRSCP
jgi:TPP-dependent pyruvate/acetoin dehydrogenase alpha subunit